MVQFVQKLCQCCNEIKPKKEISGSKSFLVYILTKIHNCGKFHQYSIFKVLRSDLASTKWPFWEVFGPFLPQIWSRIAEIPTRGRALAKKYSLKDSSIYGKGKDPKLALLVQFWPPRFPLQMVKIEKKKQFCGKSSVIGLSKYVKIQALSPLTFPGKIRLLFCNICAIFARK